MDILEQFQNASESYLKQHVGLQVFTHLSPPRLKQLLEQIDVLRGNKGTTIQSWPRYAEKWKGTPQADNLYNLIEFGLVNQEYFDQVLDILIHLISTPSYRLYTQPLMEELQFMIRAPDNEKLTILEYYLSFKCSFATGVLSYDEAIIEYNKFIIKFQCFVANNFPKNKLAVATLSQLQSYAYIKAIVDNTQSEEIDKIKEEFGINCPHEYDAEALSQLLVQPEDIASHIPDHFIPNAPPPQNILFPHFNKHALSILDASLQILYSERAFIADQIANFMDFVFDDLNPSNESKFNYNAVPLKGSIMRAAYKNSDNMISTTVTLDRRFLQFGLQLSANDIVYVIDPISRKYIGGIVRTVKNEISLIIDFDSDDVPPKEYTVLVKLPKLLSKNVHSLLNLKKCINAKDVPESVGGAFIGFIPKTQKGITVVDVPLGASSVIPAANWLSHYYDGNKKVLLIAPNSIEIDDLVVSFTKARGDARVPSMYILRADQPPEACVDYALKARSALLKSLVNAGVDANACASCSSAINYLRMMGGYDDLLGHLQALAPLDYLADSPVKAVDYMVRAMARIVCVTPSSQISDTKFDAIVVIDNRSLSDADALNLICTYKPSVLRIYSPIEAFKNDIFHRTAAERLWGSPAVDSIKEYDLSIKTEGLAAIVSKAHSLHDGEEEDNTEYREAAGVSTEAHFFECPTEFSADAIIGASSFFRMIGYSNVIEVASCDSERRAIDKVMRMRGAWNPTLLIDRDSIKQTVDVVDFGSAADVVIASSECFDDQYGRDILLSFVRAAKCVLIVIGKPFPCSDLFEEEPMYVTLDEKFGESIPNERRGFEIENIFDFLELVESMETCFYDKV